MSTMQPIRDKKDIERLKNYFLEKDEIRNYTLVVMGINLPIRISDMTFIVIGFGSMLRYWKRRRGKRTPWP